MPLKTGLAQVTVKNEAQSDQSAAEGLSPVNTLNFIDNTRTMVRTPSQDSGMSPELMAMMLKAASMFGGNNKSADHHLMPTKAHPIMGPNFWNLAKRKMQEQLNASGPYPAQIPYSPV